MNRTYKHVIFDLDGTLLNTLEDLALAANHVLEHHGWPTFAVDEYRFKVGNGIPKLIERIIPAEFFGDASVFESVYGEFASYYGAHKEDHTAPYPGVVDMLGELGRAGIKLAVLSNKDHGAVLPLVANYFPTIDFDVVQGRVDEFPPKPEPPLTLHTMERLGAHACDTLYVGDSNVDVATGHNADVPVVGVAWGFRGRKELVDAGADAIIDEPRELVRLVAGAMPSSRS